ncbi:hypothetical protein BG006_004259, partial [Podila minutissima]
SVDELMTSCSDLRALKGVGLKIGPNDFRNGVSWVCHKNEMLRLAITGLGGETRREQEHENNNDDDDGGEKYALQYLVYDQLVQLTRLRRLDLSIVCTCKVLSYVPAELSVYLLARLLGLSLMEKLGVRGVDHRIRRDELIWMQEHWTRLRWIRGVAAKIKAEQMRA